VRSSGLLHLRAVDAQRLDAGHAQSLPQPPLPLPLPWPWAAVRGPLDPDGNNIELVNHHRS
jgi:hypothetical protein